MLLTPLRVVISEWPLNVFVDLTHGFCANKVKMIGYGVNTIGWNFMPIMMGTIPDNPGEPSQMYTSAWEVFQSALRDFVYTWKTCPCGCPSCEVIRSILCHPTVEPLLDSDDYHDHGHLPLKSLNSDSSSGLLKAGLEYKEKVEPEMEINQCATHLTGIHYIHILHIQ
jgi:hypothetical protein